MSVRLRFASYIGAFLRGLSRFATGRVRALKQTTEPVTISGEQDGALERFDAAWNQLERACRVTNETEVALKRNLDAYHQQEQRTYTGI
jgi:hypothetical protein